MSLVSKSKNERLPIGRAKPRSGCGHNSPRHLRHPGNLQPGRTPTFPILTALTLLATWAISYASTYTPSTVTPPALMREIRAAWIATVANIDWPSTNALTTAQQKAEMLAILDRASELKLNTVIFQVRPACDALYASSLEPWSEYLTGTMGKPPKPFYDPLGFAIDEAHKRGLELHAWFNPYRARPAASKSAISPSHISRTHPEYVHQYGKSLWLDPGDQAVQAYALNVVMDVVRRYDIDGVHFDDYFYPYKDQGAAEADIDFPDNATWRRFGAASNLSREDWRRENVNTFIRRVYESIKAVKPWVKFGISPFGIWRPGNPPQIQGQDAFAKLFADSRLWLAKGWVDYFAPQLYWSIGQPAQSFPVLLGWWTAQNTRGRHLAPGIDSTKVGHLWPASELINQIRLTRIQTGVSGHIHWNMGALMRNRALDGMLQHGLYAQPALSPPSPWLHDQAPSKPTLAVTQAPRRLTWAEGAKEEVWLWALQTRKRKEWTTKVLPSATRVLSLASATPEVIAITAIDRYGNASAPAVIELSKRKD